MYRPYTLVFDQGKPFRVNTTPSWSVYPMEFAQEIERYEDRSGVKLIRQSFEHTPFHIDLVELSCESKARFRFDIAKKQIFLYFMLKGEALFFDDAETLIVHALQNHFLMSFYSPGIYSFEVGANHNIALVITIQPQWLEDVSGDYQHISRVTDAFKEGARPYLTMYQCKIESIVHRWIKKVYGSQLQDTLVFDGYLRMHIALLLQHYDKELSNQVTTLVERIGDYIDTHYTDADLHVKGIAKKFHITERTLYNMFKKYFLVSPIRYYTSLRVRHARRLLHKGLHMANIYMSVGYSDESSLRNALKRFKDE